MKKNRSVKWIMCGILGATACLMVAGCGSNTSSKDTVAVNEEKEDNILDGYMVQTEIDGNTGEVINYLEIPGSVLDNLTGDDIKRYCQLNQTIIDKVKTDETEIEIDEETMGGENIPAATDGAGIDSQAIPTDGKKSKKDKKTKKENCFDKYEIVEEVLNSEYDTAAETNDDSGKPDTDENNIKMRAYIAMTKEDFDEASDEDLSEYISKMNDKGYEYFSIVMDNDMAVVIHKDSNICQVGPVNEDGEVTETQGEIIINKNKTVERKGIAVKEKTEKKDKTEDENNVSESGESVEDETADAFGNESTGADNSGTEGSEEGTLDEKESSGDEQSGEIEESGNNVSLDESLSEVTQTTWEMSDPENVQDEEAASSDGDIPVEEAPAQIEESLAEAPAPAVETPAPAAEAPAVEAPAPIAEAPAPVVEAPAPAAEAPTPAVEAPAPAAEVSEQE